MNFRSLSMQAAAFFVAVSFATTVSAAASNLLASLSINGSISVGPDLPEEDVVSELTRVEIAGVFEAALGSPWRGHARVSGTEPLCRGFPNGRADRVCW